MKHAFLFILFTLVVIASSFPAQATILFAGGEDSDFILNGAAASTSAATFSSGYARESIALSSGVNVTQSPPSSSFVTPAFTASSILWVHANIDITPSGQCCQANAADLLRVFSPDGYPRISVTQSISNPSGVFTIYSINSSGSYTSLISMASGCFVFGHVSAFDLYINYATSGEVTLYCNGQQVADYTGNVTTNSATQLNQVQFGPWSGPSSYAYYNDTTNWSEIIVSTTNTRSMRLVTLPPAANGNTDTFDTGGVSNVNETTLSTANPNASGTSGEEQEYTVTTSSFPSGSYSVLGVWLNAYTQVGTTGPQHLQGVVRTGGTDYTSSNLSPPQSAWGFVSTNWVTNPNTGVAWTTGNLTAAGFNIGFNSQN